MSDDDLADGGSNPCMGESLGPLESALVDFVRYFIKRLSDDPSLFWLAGPGSQLCRLACASLAEIDGRSVGDVEREVRAFRHRSSHEASSLRTVIVVAEEDEARARGSEEVGAPRRADMARAAWRWATDRLKELERQAR